jgi:hypothetical protein
MMGVVDTAYNSIADLNFWFKNRSGEDLLLSDVPSLIPLRWPFFRDNWDFIKPKLLSNMNTYYDPGFLQEQISDFSKFIDAQRYLTTINPFQDIDTLYKFYAIFDNVSINGIDLTNQEIDILRSETLRVSNFAKNDFLNIRSNITAYRDVIADTKNLTDAEYNSVFNRSPVAGQVSATMVDINYLLYLQNSIKSVDFILSNLFAVDATVDPFALARANANNPAINIGQYQSGTLVKINYGESLESLAQRYLGSADSWLDIAIANGLKSPYIDENGETILLLSNGQNNQINLPQTDYLGNLNINKFYINQPIFLSSSTQVIPDQRTILNIRQIPVSGEIVLELDGDSNLGVYRIADGANVTVYAPNTINSRFYILIPSPEPLPDNRVDTVPWFLAKSAQDERRAKVDLAIDANGELNFTTNGDLNLSYGLDNAIQAIRLKIITELGSLPRHPNFGLVSVIGQKNSNIDAIKKTIVNSLTSQIAADNRFDRIETLAVNYMSSNKTNTGVAAITISMTVRLAGGSKVVPISFTVNNL